MKKLLLGMTSLALLFIFVLAGCSQPTETTVKSAQSSIPGPSNLKGTAVDGVTFIQWDAVPDANGYRIFRKDTKTGATVVCGEKNVYYTQNGEYEETYEVEEYDDYTDTWNLVTKTRTKTSSSYSALDTGGLYFADVVSWWNQMVDGQTYEYTVVSLNANGVNRSVQDPILSGSSKVSVKAKVPATLTVDVSNINIETRAFYDGSDCLLVIFDSQPNLSYDVSYNYGKSQSIRITSSWYDNGLYADFFTAKRAVVFPLFGGENNVEVKATFAGGLNYYAGATATAQVTTPAFARNTLGYFNSFNVKYDGTDAKLSWKDDFDIAADKGSSYTIYKAEVNKAGWDMWDIGSVKSDWTKVTTSAPKKNADTDVWTATESNAGNTKEYLYLIIATVDGVKSYPRWTPVSADTLNAVSNFRIVEGAKKTELQAMWDADVAATYKLQYAPISGTQSTSRLTKNQLTNVINNDSVIMDVDYVAAKVVADNYPQGKAVVNFSTATTDNKIEVGSPYIFKLVETKDGIDSDPIYFVYNQDAFKEGVSFTLTRLSGATFPNNYTEEGTDEYTKATSMRLQLNDGGTFTEGVGYTIELYYRDSSSPANTFKKIDLGTKATIAQNYSSSDPDKVWRFTQNSTTALPLSMDTHYQYKLVVFDSTGKKELGDYILGDEVTYSGSWIGSPATYVAGQSAQLYSATYYTTEYKPDTAKNPDVKIAAKHFQISGSNNMEGVKVTLKYKTTATGNPYDTFSTTISMIKWDTNNGVTTAGTTRNWNKQYFIEAPSDYSETASNGYQSMWLTEGSNKDDGTGSNVIDF